MTQYICSRCHYTGKPRLRKRGSTKTEFFMWTMFPIGVPYTLWRMFGKTPICRECGYDILVDTESMLGLRLMAAYEQEMLQSITKKQPITHAQENQNTITSVRPTITVSNSAIIETPTAPASISYRPHQDPNQW